MNLFSLATRGVDLDALPTEEQVRTPIAFDPPSRVSAPAEFDKLFADAGDAYGVDPAILKSIAFAESGFQPEIISGKRKSSAGAIGMMQFMPETAKEYGIDPTNPVEAVFGAAAYMRQSLDKFNGDYGKAVASYNAGRNRKDFDAEDWDTRLPAETQGYLAKVFGVVDKFKPQAPQTPVADKAYANNTSDETARLAARYPAKASREVVPDMTVGSVAQDTLASALAVGPTVLKVLGELSSLATGGRVGQEFANDMQKRMDTVTSMVGSERGAAQKRNFQRDMADDNVSIGDALLRNKGAMVDMALPSLGSMLLPVGAAGAAGKLATVGKVAQGLDKVALAARVASVQQAAGIGAVAAQNAASTFAELVDKGVSLPDAYTAAGITVPFSLIAGKLTGGGAEGALIKGLGKGGAAEAIKRGVAEVPKAMIREGGQEVGEEAGQALGEAYGTKETPSMQAVGKRLAVAGTMGAVVGGGMNVAEQGLSMKQAPTVESQPTTPQAPVAPGQAPVAPVAPTTQGAQAVDQIQAILEAERNADQGSPVTPNQPASDAGTAAVNPTGNESATEGAGGNVEAAVSGQPESSQALTEPSNFSATPTATVGTQTTATAGPGFTAMGIAAEMAALKARSQPQAQPTAPKAAPVAPAETATTQPSSLAAEMSKIKGKKAANTEPAGLLTNDEREMLAQFQGLYQADLKGEIRQRLGLAPKEATEATAAPKRTSALLSMIVQAGGIKSGLSNDLTGGNPMEGNKRYPGLFRRNGQNLDTLVQTLKERGFLTQADEDNIMDNGGVNKLAEMVQAELSGERAKLADNTDGFEQQRDDAMRSEMEDKASALGLSPDLIASMSNDRLNGTLKRIEARLGHPIKTDFATRKMSRAEARAEREAILMADRVERARQKYDADLQAFAEADDMVQDAALDVFTDENGDVVIVNERDADAELAARTLNGSWSDQNGQETATTQDSGTSADTREDRAPVARGSDQGTQADQGNGSEAGAGEEGYLTTLFGSDASQLSEKPAPKPSGGADLKAFVPKLREFAQKKLDEANDWVSREYKDNRTQIDLRGDGPTRQESISVSQANESRRRRNVDALTQQAQDASNLANRIERGRDVNREISAAINNAQDGKGPAIGKTLQDKIEGYISNALLGDENYSYGDGTLASLIRKTYEDGAGSQEALTTYTAEEATAKQDAQAKAEREAKTRKDAEDRTAKNEDEKKRIAQASVHAADTFELGQDPLDSLTGQEGLKFSKNAESLDAITRSLDDAGVSNTIYERDGVITVSKIVVPKDQRNSGIGTDAMQRIVAYADRTGQHIALTPSADFGGNKSRLTEFYKRFGFKENKGRNRVFSVSESMVRENPKGKTLFSFAGSRAQNTDRMGLMTAQDRIDAGDDAETVRQETGWFKGVDGRWRFEISDSDATVDTTLLGNLTRGGFDARPIEFITYRKDDDGTYRLTLTPKSPQKTTDFVSLSGVPESMLPSIIPMAAQTAITNNTGEEDYIGGNLDNALRVRAPFQFEGFNALPLDVVMGHPKLFAAYPALREIMVRVDTSLGNGATFAEMDYVDGTKGKEIRIGNPKAANVDNVLLHEIQHGIQSIEGFATGGSPNGNAKAYAAQISRELSDLVASDGRLEAAYRAFEASQNAMEQAFSSGQDFDADAAQRNEDALAAMPNGQRVLDMYFSLAGLASDLSAPSVMRDRYKRLAGEVEARNTQTRQRMTDAERRTKSPSATADVADSNVIVVMNGKEMAYAPTPDNAIGMKPATTRTPITTIAQAITKAYGNALTRLQSKGMVSLTQTEEAALKAAADARAAKNGTSAEVELKSLRASVLASMSPMKSIDANVRRGLQSLAKALDGKTTVHRAMFRNGLGWVDFVWGSEGAVKPSGKTKGAMGISHILEARQRKDGMTEADAIQLLNDVVNTIASGAEASRTELGSATRVRVELGNTLVWLTKQKGSNAWIVTAYEKNPDGANAGRATFAPTSPAASRTRDQRVAGFAEMMGLNDLDVKRSADGQLQGFFDPATGQSFLVADNLTAETAPAVFAHEVGIHMAADGMLQPVFDRATTILATERTSPFVQRVQDRMDQSGETSGEEAAAYIVEEYERDRTNAPASVTKWVKDFIASVRAWLFNKGVILKADQLTVADIAAIARANLKSLAKGDAQTDQASPDIRRSVAPAQQSLINPSQQWQMPELPPDSSKLARYFKPKLENFVYEIQDQRIDLKNTQAAIKAAGRAITENFDARQAETLMPGRVAFRTETFLKTEAAPLMEAMAKNNVSQNELSDYLLARHAPERNAQIAKVNPDMPDGGAGTNSQGVLMTTQAANDHIAALTTGKKLVLDMLAKKVDAMTKGTQDLLVREGLEKQSSVDAWNAAYKHYVPLFKDEAADTTSHPIGSGLSVTGSASKRATGSEGEVTNMVAHLLMQREAAIVRAEKNRVAMALYGLALSNPNPDMWTTVRPTMSAEKIGKELAAMGVDPVEAESGMQGVPTIRSINPITGQVQDTPNPMYKRLDNALVVKVGGEDRVILFNKKNPTAARMAGALKNLDGLSNLNLAGSIVGKTTRFMASMSTQYNPAFGMVNVVRDVGGALVNLSSTELKGQQAKVLGSVPAALKGIARDLEGKQRTPWSDLWQQFQEDGGRTGYRDIFASPFERAAAVQKDIDRMQAEGKWTAGNAAHAVLDLLDNFNTSLENAVRLSAYKAALDSGMSRAQAAKLGRELTVDFNRKGRAGREMGPLYAFFNASVQGTARTLESIKGPAGQKIIAGGLMLGVLQALMLAAADFDDDEPPDFVKARAFIIPTGDKRYIAIPLQFGLNVLPNTGRVITELLMTGGKDAGKKAFDAVGELAGSFNPLGGGNIFTAHGILTTISPTVIDPIIDIGMNTSFAGTPIGKERQPWDTRPGFELARESTKRSATGQVYIGISKAINNVTGGNDYKKGEFSPTPEQVQYLFNTVGGGVYRELEKSLNAVALKAQGIELKARQIPLGSRFAGEADDADTQRSRYYKNTKRLNELEVQLRGFGRDGNDKAIADLEKTHADELDALGTYKGVKKAISSLDKLASESLDDPKALSELDKERTELMRELNEAIREAEKKAK